MPQGTDGLLRLCIGRVRQNRHTPLIPLRALRLVPGSYISGAGFRAVEGQDLLLAQVRHGLPSNRYYHLLSLVLRFKTLKP
jgi:hypothetical protein